MITGHSWGKNHVFYYSFYQYLSLLHIITYVNKTKYMIFSPAMLRNDI